jgi:hypothetical protein
MPDNAAEAHALALDLLHYSPEPRVIERLIDSAELLGRTSEAQFHRLRYAAWRIPGLCQMAARRKGPGCAE